MASLKNCWKSLTIWFNSVCLAILPMLDYAKENFEQLHDYLGEQTFKTMGLIIIAGNIVLRFKTTQGLAQK